MYFAYPLWRFVILAPSINVMNDLVTYLLTSHVFNDLLSVSLKNTPRYLLYICHRETAWCFHQCKSC